MYSSFHQKKKQRNKRITKNRIKKQNKSRREKKKQKTDLSFHFNRKSNWWQPWLPTGRIWPDREANGSNWLQRCASVDWIRWNPFRTRDRHRMRRYRVTQRLHFWNRKWPTADTWWLTGIGCPSIWQCQLKISCNSNGHRRLPNAFEKWRPIHWHFHAVQVKKRREVMPIGKRQSPRHPTRSNAARGLSTLREPKHFSIEKFQNISR